MTLFVSNSTQLRSAIQSVGSSDPTIQLTGAGTFSSVTTLGKFTCVTPQEIPYAGYTIQGQSSTLTNSATLLDTRIFQQNIDTPQGMYLPGVVQNLTLNYTSASANTNAILSLQNSASRSLTIDTVDFTGSHAGWTGANGVYMTLTSGQWSSAAPIDTTLTLNKVNVSLTGQSGFAANTVSGGASFLQVANNKAKVTVSNSVFDEAGFSTSFNFANYPGKPTGLQTYEITQNTFKRTTNANVRSEGNSLQNINATLSGNVFQDGSYVDLYGDISGVTFQNDSLGNGNTFSTITDGFGIRVTAAAGAPRNMTLSGTPTFTGTTTFTGPGLALKYVSATANDHINYSGTFTVGGKSFARLIAGGQANDNLQFTGLTLTNLWISGDDGNDTIQSSTGADCLIGGAGNDSLVSNNGADVLDGGTGSDYLDGGAGLDVLSGGDDNDTLIGGVGNDTLTGGAGADVFSYSSGDQSDTITDFSISQSAQSDRMRLGSVAFANTTAGSALSASDYLEVSSLTSTTAMNLKVTELTTNYSVASANAFTASSASTVNGYLLFFDSTTNRSWLYYDADWRNTGGRQAAVWFSNITTLNDLTAFTNTQFLRA